MCHFPFKIQNFENFKRRDLVISVFPGRKGINLVLGRKKADRHTRRNIRIVRLLMFSFMLC